MTAAIERAPAAPERAESEAIYVYGFVPSAPTPPDSLAGIAGRPVEVVGRDGFAVAVSRVPAAEYAGDAVEPRLRDLEWVAEQGIGHERVVTWFVDASAIIPARLLTLYSSLEALERGTATLAPRIARELARLEGCREWDVKVTMDAGRLEAHVGDFSETAAQLRERIERAAPGTRYLLERKRADLLRDEIADVARRLAGELLGELRTMCLDSRVLAPPPEAPQDLPVVLNAALLVHTDGEAALGRIVEERSRELERVGLHVACSGPWAPYRFVEALEGWEDDREPVGP